MREFREQAEIANSALPPILATRSRAVADILERPKRERRLVAALQESAQGNAALFVHWRDAPPAGSGTSYHSAMSC
jgi:hypothetical protein